MALTRQPDEVYFPPDAPGPVRSRIVTLLNEIYADARRSELIAIDTDTGVAAGQAAATFRATAALTLALPPAAVLGAGFVFRVLADGGDVTLDPEGADTIDGAATRVVPEGATARVICDGAAWFARLSAGIDGSGAQTVDDFDALSESGAYQGDGATGAPEAGVCFVEHVEGDTDTAVQYATPAGADDLHLRRRTGPGAWAPWVRLARADELPATQIGVGQTWQDMSASRTHSTSYQNTTGAPIMVAIQCDDTGSVQIQVSSDNATWHSVGNANGGFTSTSQFIVPDGSYYRLDGATTILHWSELRA